MSITYSLHEQQQAFAAAVLARHAQEPPLQALFTGAPKHIMRRLAVYRANLQAARVSALQTAFPTVLQIVGEEFFAGLAREYGFAHPSASGNLNHFGNAFAGFLESFAPAAELPYLSDVARLDWAMHKADSAADAPALNVEALAKSLVAHSASSVTLVLHDSVAIVRSLYPLADIWRYNDEAARLNGVALESLTPPNWSQAQSVLVCRNGWRAKPTPIPATEAAALTALQSGESLQAALTAALTLDNAINLPQLLARWCSLGIFIGVKAC